MMMKVSMSDWVGRIGTPAISNSANGTTIAKRRLAAWSSPYSPDHSRCTPSGRWTSLRFDASHRGWCSAIAIAHRKSDRHVTLQRLAVDEGRALAVSIFKLVEPGILAAGGRLTRIWRHRIQAPAILRIPLHHQVEAPIAFKHLSDRLSPDRRWHNRADVADIESITRARGPVRGDLQIGLAHRAQDYFIDNAGHAAQRFPQDR